MAPRRGRSTSTLGVDVVTASDPALVNRRLTAELSTLDDLAQDTRSWFNLHKVAPRIVSLAKNTDGTDREDFWLITDHTGAQDSSYRIYFDESKDRFGRECILDTGVPLLLGVFPSLRDALEDIV